jgi:hypothetical protein
MIFCNKWYALFLTFFSKLLLCAASSTISHFISLLSLSAKQTRFDSVGKTIETRLQDMDHRMTELETSIQELMDQAGLNGTTPKSNNNNNSSAKGKAEI